MDIAHLKDRLLEVSSLARRLYGLKIMIMHGPSDASKWFLFNRNNLKYQIELQNSGIVLDIGSYLGDFTERLMLENPDSNFWLYEPISKYFKVAKKKFQGVGNVSLYQSAVSADGRNIAMKIDGLRSRQETYASGTSIEISSISIQDIFDSANEIELVKMNIEGMEFECLEQLIVSNSLIKARNLLIQFHNFEKDSKNRREVLRKELEKEFINIFTYEWVWELWTRKEK